MLARTNYGIAESFHADQGRTWSEPQNVDNRPHQHTVSLQGSRRTMLREAQGRMERTPKRCISPLMCPTMKGKPQPF